MSRPLTVNRMFISLLLCLLLQNSRTEDSEGKNEPYQYRNLVHTTHGQIQGTVKTVNIQNENVMDVDVFWGIPFAKPPVGSLRFKPPTPANSWTGIRKAAEPPKSCMQVIIDDPAYAANPTTETSEDCLYLNVWRPHCSEDDDDSPLATLVWIYGGGYMSGSTTVPLYDGGVLAASECVVVASMNYRLGALGFLFLDDPEVAGNMGLLDQVLALQWLKENIQHFGGDPERITLFGNSAGAASIALHLLSPLSRHLFCAAVIQSGSSTSALASSSKEAALAVARRFIKSVGCENDEADNISEVIGCLRQVNVDTLTKVHFDLVNDYHVYMTVVEDDYFLTGRSVDLLKSGNFKHCPLLLGVTKDEGTIFMGLQMPEEFNLHTEQTTCITEQSLDAKLETLLASFIKSEHVSQMMSSVKDVYKLKDLQEQTNDGHLTLLNYVIGDVINICNVGFMAEAFANRSVPTFLYSFQLQHQGRFASWVGAMHGTDLGLWFGLPFRDNDEGHRFSSDETQLSAALMFYLGNFAKFGSPQPSSYKTKDHVTWPQFKSPALSDLLVIQGSLQPSVLSPMEKQRCSLWKNLPDEFLLYH